MSRSLVDEAGEQLGCARPSIARGPGTSSHGQAEHPRPDAGANLRPQLDPRHGRFHDDPIAVLDSHAARIVQGDFDSFWPRISSANWQLAQPGQLPHAALGIARAAKRDEHEGEAHGIASDRRWRQRRRSPHVE